MATKSSYTASEREVLGLFSDYLEGEAGQPALVLSTRRAGDVSRDALAKSFAAFKWGSDACLYATLYPVDGDAEGGDIMLDAQALFLLVEGIDPLVVVCTDERAVKALGEAYRLTPEPGKPTRIFGRPAALFENLESLLSTERGKQVAWALLKTLRH